MDIDISDISYDDISWVDIFYIQWKIINHYLNINAKHKISHKELWINATYFNALKSVTSLKNVCFQTWLSFNDVEMTGDIITSKKFTDQPAIAVCVSSHPQSQEIPLKSF